MPPVQSVADLLAALDRRAPFGKAAGWDPVGLQLGDPGQKVERIAVCHEVTEAVVGALEAEPVDLLVSYHPLLFEPSRSWLAGPTPAGRALRLARLGTSLAVAHSNFDVAPGGVADALAEALELEQLSGFGPLWGPDSLKLATFLPAAAADAVLDAVVAAGAARVGNYTHCSYRSEGLGTFFAGEGTSPATGAKGALNREPEVRLEFAAPAAVLDAVVGALVAAHPYEEPAYDVYERRGEAGMLGRLGRPEPGTTLHALAARVARALGNPALRVAGDPSRELERVAVIPGSGADLLPLAAALGADAVVTGDLGHHAVRSVLERGLGVIDPGHAATERPGVERLYAALAALGAPTRSLLELDPDPWIPHD